MAIRDSLRTVPRRPRLPGSEGRTIALVLVSVAQFLIALDYSIVYLALPRITTDLHLDPAAGQWVISAYAVTFAGFLVVGGRLADRFGSGPSYIAAILLFGLSSAVGAAAGSGAVLI